MVGLLAGVVGLAAVVAAIRLVEPSLLGVRVHPLARRERILLFRFRLVEYWGRTPLSLRAYIALSVVIPLIQAVLRGPLALIGLPVALIFAFFLLKQNRVFWFLLIAFQLLALPTYVSSNLVWIYYVLVGVNLTLLLTPESRRFFSDRTSSDRPAGRAKGMRNPL
ncbi:MAG TPA: hypothetical protein VHU86_01985 [Solirubrobacterales bacterium]|jgi:hypothetical protein|nr:hypothetical protein [Solirubrobacterales bacterium]